MLSKVIFICKYVCIKHCNVDTPQNKLLFLLTIFWLYFFCFKRIATKKTSRWVAAHPGQRYSLLFIYIENVLFERKLVPVLQHCIVKFKRVD